MEQICEEISVNLCLSSALSGGNSDNGTGARVVRVGGNDSGGGGGSSLDIHIYTIVTGLSGSGGLLIMGQS